MSSRKSKNSSKIRKVSRRSKGSRGGGWGSKKSRGGSRCSRGEIMRKGYTFRRSNGTRIRVSKSCIKDRGAPGKGPKLIVIPKETRGFLEKYGYNLSESFETRVKALRRAMKEEDPLVVLRRVNAIRTLQKSNLTNYRKLDRDMKWIQEHYER